MDKPPFCYEHRVTYADCTIGNHVYYGHYLQFLEAARGAFFRDLGLNLTTLQQEGIILPVIECHLAYKAPARYDDVLRIAVWPAKVERVRLTFGYRLTHSGEKLILEAETVHVCTGLDEKPRRMPAELSEKLLAGRQLPPA